MRVRLAALAIAGFALVQGPVHADPAAFFKDQQMTVLVGYGPGGGYDTYARLVARHFSRNMAGNPAVIVQNMPGAGSLRATNFLYNNAPKDGTMFGTFARNMPLLSVLGGNKNVQFDATKFTWLGSPSSGADDAYMLFVRRDAKVNTLEAARKKGGDPIVLGGTAEGATGNDIALLIRDTLGVNIKLITGYPDSGALFLGIDRGEIDGRFVGLSAVSANKPEWLKPGGIVRPLLQFARKERHPDFKDVPTAREIASEDERALRLIQLTEIPYLLSRPFAAPPGLPADRAKALRAAFAATMADKAFMADSAKMGVDVSPVGAEEADEMLQLLLSAPEDLKEQLRKLQRRG